MVGVGGGGRGNLSGQKGGCIYQTNWGGCEIPSGVTTSISASVSGSKATMERLAAVKGVGLLIPRMSGSKYS